MLNLVSSSFYITLAALWFQALFLSLLCSEGRVLTRGCSTKRPVFHVECENHVSSDAKSFCCHVSSVVYLFCQHCIHCMLRGLKVLFTEQCSGQNPVFLRILLTRWAVRRGSASATAATSCATPPPPWSPPSPPSPPSSHLFSSFSPCPSPSPPSLPSSSLWPISRQIRLLPQGVNSARELYHNYLEQQMLQSLVFRRNKRFL